MDQRHHQSPTPPALPPRGEFSEAGYLQLHPDVAAAIDTGVVGSAWQHFVLHGAREGRAWVSQPDPLLGVSREIAPGDEMFAANEDHYFDVGASALRCIEAGLFAAQREKASIKKVLDLPCGHGRVMRFLRKAFPAARLTACDLHRDGVAFCAQAFGAEPVVSSVDIERIPLRGPFDLIWCGSLLTHLAEDGCAAFLQLFHRSLARGGILVFTMHGRGCEAELASGKNTCGLDDQRLAELLAGYRQKGFAYVNYADQPGYGFSLAQPTFVLANFVQRPEWRLLSYHENGWDRRQDVICLARS